MGETVAYVWEDGRIVIWDEESPSGWIVLDPDVIMSDTELAPEPEPDSQTDAVNWTTNPDDIDINDDQDSDWK